MTMVVRRQGQVQGGGGGHLRWTLSMQRPDRRFSLIVDLNQVFTLRIVLKDLSTVLDVAGTLHTSNSG